MKNKLNKLICRWMGHDSAISFAPDKKSPSGYRYYRHCLRCKEILEEDYATI